MLHNIELWKKVASDSALLQAVANSTLDNVASMSKLRVQWSVDEITISAKLNDARQRARYKLDDALTIVADPEGVQQATSSPIAKVKAMRFDGCEHIVDLCCGIGADLQALPQHATGIDIDPLRCWMAHQNTGKVTKCEDVTTTLLPSNCVVHIDPARRNEAGRLLTLEAMVPPFKDVVRIVASSDAGCIKLSPAINPEDVEAIARPYEVEYFEEGSRVRQAALWYGSLAKNEGEVTATSITTGQSFTAIPAQPTFSTDTGSWILEPNVALERAGTHGVLGNDFNATEPSPGIGLLCANANPESQWFTAFEILETTSLRIEKVARFLRDFGCTQVEVKTRDKTVDPNVWQKKLNKASKGPLLTIFALRFGKKRIVFITRRH